MTVQHSLEQLTPDRLADLSRFLEQLLKIINAYRVNDSTQPNQLLQAEQPWLKYTAILKDSPNWDEFLEILAEARREDTDHIRALPITTKKGDHHGH